jgi:hypothetical protein
MQAVIAAHRLEVVGVARVAVARERIAHEDALPEPGLSRPVRPALLWARTHAALEVCLSRSRLYRQAW